MRRRPAASKLTHHIDFCSRFRRACGQPLGRDSVAAASTLPTVVVVTVEAEAAGGEPLLLGLRRRREVRALGALLYSSMAGFRRGRRQRRQRTASLGQGALHHPQAKHRHHRALMGMARGQSAP